MRRVTAPSLMWIPSTNNIVDVVFASAKPLNPSCLRCKGHSEEIPLDELLTAVDVATGVRTFRLYGIPINHIGPSFPSPVKFTWHGQTLYRYLWDTLAFPVETNCPHLERLPSFYTTVGHVPVPGEFHGGCLFPLSKDNSGLSQDFIVRIMFLARKWSIVQSLD